MLFLSLVIAVGIYETVHYLGKSSKLPDSSEYCKLECTPLEVQHNIQHDFDYGKIYF